MIRYGGSAMDSAIATVVCIGATIFEGTSIAGGHFMTVYDRYVFRIISTIHGFILVIYHKISNKKHTL